MSVFCQRDLTLIEIKIKKDWVNSSPWLCRLILPQYELNWIKIMYFLLIANYLASPIFYSSWICEIEKKNLLLHTFIFRRVFGSFIQSLWDLSSNGKVPGIHPDSTYLHKFQNWPDLCVQNESITRENPTAYNKI